MYNLRFEISDLRLSALCASAPLHLTKLSSFVIVFMQNKANFRKSQVNVRPLVIMNYEEKSNWTLGENKPNSKPNKANFKIGKINVSVARIKAYDNKQRTTNNERYSKQTQTKPIKANVENQGRWANRRNSRSYRKR